MLLRALMVLIRHYVRQVVHERTAKAPRHPPSRGKGWRDSEALDH